ncbi:hypothetical protein [Caballeronia novacaledonica]|uniref:Uncharacterized protein n=1 Tax=Caballeronia novacaledonica TaxID=1544861 RepID=A0AA37MIR4_9BURK|nr:hypothetical protein [Caballeronia novacaledonica]GJH28935.1 hypothetical protein CBA19CS42_30485 [Caballeronia novacaledonica]
MLTYLPRLFARPPQASALQAFAGAFGGELVQARNTLAALMFAHWVDYADRNADEAIDLTQIAALYGLAPRADETVEEFRAHLKRYVRTLLEGTATVKGMLRVSAESLGLVIADDDARLDAWWNRPARKLVTTVPDPTDAATLLFGWPQASARGSAAQPARFVGTVDLSPSIDLWGRSVMKLSTNGAPAVTLDFADTMDVSAATPGALAAALDTLDGISAMVQGGRLVIASEATGSESTLELLDLAGDASAALLGIAPLSYTGEPPVNARIVGALALPATLNLSERRYLRIVIDGTHAVEVDCAGANAAATTPDEIAGAIGRAAGAGVATIDQGRLALMSPTPGLAGTIELRPPTAGSAMPLLFGDAPAYARGRDASPAQVASVLDLSAGVDLSVRARLIFSVDAFAPVNVDCAGAVPQKTLASEIAAAINRAIGVPVAAQNGPTLTLSSRASGPSGAIRLLHAPDGDALDLIFGFAPRRATGADASAASLVGTVDLSHGVDLRALYALRIALDDGDPFTVDFASAGLASEAVKPSQIVEAVNTRAGVAIMSTDGTRLALASGEPGMAGAIAVQPIETTLARPFVTRAYSVDEAGSAVFGTFAASAAGSGATGAVLSGTVEVRDGVDLRTQRYLRVALDDAGGWHDVDCAASTERPRTALLGDIARAVCDACGALALAGFEDGHLVLRSSRAGASSRVALLADAGDAGFATFGSNAAKASGSGAQRLVFTSLVDFSRTVDLSAAGRVRLAIDGGAPANIECAGADPAHTTAAEIAGRINAALGATWASTDGRALRIGSAATGKQSTIAFLAPDAQDATRTIFGIDAGRTYQGADATAAILSSAHELPAALDLSAAPWLRIAIDGGAPVLIDCRGADPHATTPAEIAARIDAAFAGSKAARAQLDSARVQVASASTGVTSSVALQAAADFAATTLLFGAPAEARGSDAVPATLVGAVDLRSPVDLSRRAVLRIAFDGGRPLDIDVSGAAPEQTFGNEIAAAIEAVRPAAATLDDAGQMVLRSATAGADSRVELLPVRAIELIDYPEWPMSVGPLQLASGDHFDIRNDSANESIVSFELSGAQGFSGVHLVNMTTQQAISVATTVSTGEVLKLAATLDSAIEVTLTRPDGSVSNIDARDVVAAPFLVSAAVPFEGERPLVLSGLSSCPSLVLIDPLARHEVRLELRGRINPRPTVRVAAAQLPQSAPLPQEAGGRIEVLGRLTINGAQATLVDANDALIVRVRAGAGVSLARFDGLAVSAIGTFYPGGDASLLSAETVAALFDVNIGPLAFDAVTLDPRSGTRSLVARIAAGDGRIAAWDCAPAAALRLPEGRSRWTLLACRGDRFDHALYDFAHFAGGACDEAAVFDLSRFNAPGDIAAPPSRHLVRARFGPLAAQPSVTVTARWLSHAPGRFTVNLPADLPPKFGARFNQAHFASIEAKPLTYGPVVLDTPVDDSDIVKVLDPKAPGRMVGASRMDIVPLGWTAVPVPFRQPRVRYLSGGGAHRPAAIYLQEHGVPGFIGIVATSDGVWGNDIAVSVLAAGPGTYDIEVSYAAACFECARQIVREGRTASQDARSADPTDALKAGGVLRHKAAGVQACVTRERT